MDRKDHIDAFGAISLTLFSALLSFNHVVIKLTNAGLQPVFSAGLRSVGALLVLVLAFRVAGRRMAAPEGSWPGLLIMGAAFSAEFVFLYVALDLTTVARTAVIFYSMPVWMGLGAHFLIPGDRLSPVRMMGLALAMAGVAWAILHRPSGGSASVAGDLAALAAAMLWATIGLAARGTQARAASAEMQLTVQLAMSAVVLLVAAPFFGPLVRDITWVTWAGMGFQIFVVASAGFLFWLWLLKIYPASSVAAFSFLSTVFGVFFGWLMLGERIGPGTWGSLGLVALGLVLINRRQVPQKVA